jgi:hypothetical protein
MFDVKPIKKNDPNNPGKKFDDFWEAGQKVGASDETILHLESFICMYV